MGRAMAERGMRKAGPPRAQPRVEGLGVQFMVSGHTLLLNIVVPGERAPDTMPHLCKEHLARPPGQSPLSFGESPFHDKDLLRRFADIGSRWYTTLSPLVAYVGCRVRAVSV